MTITPTNQPPVSNPVPASPDPNSPTSLKRVLSRYEAQRALLTIWFTHWQRIAEWLFTRKASFTNTFNEAEFLDRQIFDTTAPLALDIASSAMLDILFPSGGQSIEIMPADEIAEDADCKDYFAWATEKMAQAMDDPNANLATTLSEYMKESLAFGNSGIAVLEDDDGMPHYQHMSIREFVFLEGNRSKIDEVWWVRQRTISQVVKDVGIENVHRSIRERFNKGDVDAYIPVMRYVGPRPDGDRKGAPRSKLNMPYCSLTIDYQNQFTMHEDGFVENPLIVGRYDRFANELPGRGPGSRALPEIVKANAISESILLATEKKLDPPLWVTSEMGNGTVDKSAGGVTVFRPKGNVSAQSPVGQLFTVGELTEAVAQLEVTQGNIKAHFYLDRLLDMSGDQKEMSATESVIRDTMRNKTLREPINRQVAETFTPLVTRTWNIQFRNGKLGAMPGTIEYDYAKASGGMLVPDAVVRMLKAGKTPWKIHYKTPAARAAYAQAAQNSMAWAQQNATLAQLTADTGLTALANGEELSRDLAKYLGISTEGLRSRKVMANMRDQQAQKAEQQATVQNAAALMQASNGSPDVMRMLASSGGVAQGNGA